MTTKSLIEGVIRILRDNVTGWATDGQGMKQVVPNHPSNELGQSMYPRATVDVVSNNPDVTNVTVDKFIEDVGVEITVYSTSDKEMNRLKDDCRQAIIDFHDSSDSNGSMYLPESYLQELGAIGPAFEDEETLNVTRYNRSFEVDFKTLIKSN